MDDMSMARGGGGGALPGTQGVKLWPLIAATGWQGEGSTGAGGSISNMNQGNKACCEHQCKHTPHCHHSLTPVLWPLFWNKKCYPEDDGCQIQPFFSKAVLKATNSHCVILQSDLPALSPRNSRFSRVLGGFRPNKLQHRRHKTKVLLYIISLMWPYHEVFKTPRSPSSWDCCRTGSLFLMVRRVLSRPGSRCILLNKVTKCYLDVDIPDGAPL